ncbi:hypothetical protein IAU60_003302 [Kwoniella sp. DSM 27419]
MAAKRIKKEIADISKENLGSMTLAPNESDIFQWKATLPGPSGSPYEGGVFEVDIKVPDDYPFSPPRLHFVTKVYHCNIASTGAICLDLLKNAWSPALSLYKVILSLSSLLTDPNPGDPLVPAIAQEYKKNRKQHDATAREWVRKYATPKAQAASQPQPAQPKASTSRPRAITRPSSSATASPGPPAATPPAVQMAGTRRAASSRDPIDLVDSDEEGGPYGVASGAHEGGTGTANGADERDRTGQRRSKRSRANGHATAQAGGTGTAGASAGDAIVIDE